MNLLFIIKNTDKQNKQWIKMTMLKIKNKINYQFSLNLMPFYWVYHKKLKKSFSNGPSPCWWGIFRYRSAFQLSRTQSANHNARIWHVTRVRRNPRTTIGCRLSRGLLSRSCIRWSSYEIREVIEQYFKIDDYFILSGVVFWKQNLKHLNKNKL